MLCQPGLAAQVWRKLTVMSLTKSLPKPRDCAPAAGRRRSVPVLSPFVGLLLLAACGPAATPVGISDPNEAQNRVFHDLNVSFDKAILRPVAMAYVQVLPDPVERGVANFADNLDVPGQVVNDILQLQLDHAFENTLRFAINTTIGIGGLFDPAAALGVQGRKTDFGETLHVWGLPEGDYSELPLVGPSTDRDNLGILVDYIMNPLRLLIPSPESRIATAAGIFAKIGDRGRYSATVDSILYDSADGYAQARILYLQNRRFELGMSATSDDSFEDPYAE